MLVALTSLALIALAIHTKRIYENAMKEMLAERPLPPQRRPRLAAQRSPSQTRLS